jgi:diguanylate cyclase (GGDEF)-like protein
MPQDQILLTILAVVVFANVLLVTLVPIRARAQRRSLQQERVQPDRPGGLDTPVARPPAGGPSGPHLDLSRPGASRDDDDDARAAAAIEAFVAEVSADAAGRARPPAPWEVITRRREAVTSVAADRTPSAFRAMGDPQADRREPSTMPVPERPLHPSERTPGLADPAMWDRLVREESARVARFGRPITVVMAELRRLDGVADRLGRDVADRVVTETASLLVTEGRSVDRIAWLGDARFGVLLLETEESGASHYVDRVRAVADGWLESAGLSLRLSLGWASPVEGGDVIAAAATAQQRMLDVDPRSSPGADMPRSPKRSPKAPRSPQ